MKKITTLLISLLAVATLTACDFELHGSETQNGGNEQTPSGNEQNQNGQGNGNYTGDGANGNGTPTNGNGNEPGNGSGNGNTNSGNPTGGDNNNNQTDPNQINTITIGVDELALGYGWQDGSQYSSFQLDTVISVSSEGGSNTGKYYSNTQGESYRLYGTEQAILTISAAEGQKIRGVTLTFTTKNNGAFEQNVKSGVEMEFDTNSVSFNVSAGTILITEFSVKYTGAKGVDPFYRDAWTNEELALINKYIYGVSVPYVYMRGNVLEYYVDDSDTEGVFTLYGAKCTLAEILPYVEAFRVAEGWEELSDDDIDNDFFFEIKTTVNGQERYVRANIYLSNGYYLVEDSDTVGVFNIDFFDPYYYEWPTTEAAFVAQSVGSTSVIPAVSNVSLLSIDQYDEETYVITSYYHQDSDFTSYLQLVDQTYNVVEIPASGDVPAIYDAIPKALDDIELMISYYDNTIIIVVCKHLPHLSEFPQQQIKDYNGGTAIPPVQGADYYTFDKDVWSYYDEEYDETYEFILGVYVCAYGIDTTELAAWVSDLNTAHWSVTNQEDEENGVIYYLAEYKQEGEKYYYFNASYYVQEQYVEITVNEEIGLVYSTSFPTSALQSFLSTKGLTSVSVPNLALSSVTGYYYQSYLNSVEYYDQIDIYVEGDHESEWTDILDNAGYYVPDTPDEEYGYECCSSDYSLEIDVFYDADSGMTSLCFYSVADLS